MKKLPDNQIAFYQSPDGAVNIEVLYAEENIWLRALHKIKFNFYIPPAVAKSYSSTWD